MEHLDDFFKNKMSQRQIEFDEAHWAAAEALLDKQKRKKRLAFWWWFGGAASVLVTALLLWWFWPQSAPSPLSSFFDLPALAKSEAPTTDATVQPDVTETPQTSAPHSSNANLSPSSKQNPSSDTRDTFAAKAKEEIDRTAEKAFTERKKTTITAKEEKAKADQKAKVQNNSKPEKKPNQNKAQANADQKVKRLAIPMLSTLEREPLRYERQGNFGNAQREEPMIKVAYEKWRWGAAAYASLYPYRTGANESLIGWKTGLFSSYHLNTNWYIESGIQYHLRTGQFGFAKAESIANYRFGKSELNYFLLPTQLHYLQIPLLVGYQNNRHRLAIGAQLNYLLGIRGSLRTSFDGVSDPNLFNTNQVEQGWIVKDGFKIWPIDVSMGYGYELGTHWMVEVQLNYTMGSVLDESYERPFPLIYRESEPLQVQLGIRYFID